MLDDHCPGFHTGDRAHNEEPAQAHIDVAQGAVPPGSDDRFAHHVRQVRAHDKIHRHAGPEHHWPRQEAASNAEEASQNADDESDQSQEYRACVDAGDWEFHRLAPQPEPAQQPGCECVQQHPLCEDGGDSDDGVDNW